MTSDPGDQRSVTLHHADGLALRAHLDADGDLVITGQDLKPPNGWREYEWAYRVPCKDVPLLVAALGGDPGDHLPTLMAADGERLALREREWLSSAGATYTFWNRIEP